MRILAFSPFDPATLSGNSTTLRRVQKALQARGHAFEIVAVSPTTSRDDAAKAIDRFRPDVLHFYHSYKTGRLLPSLPRMPAVVTVSGTDLNHDYEVPERREVIDQAIARAGGVVTYNASLAARVPRATVIPKGVTLGDRPFDLRGTAGVREGAFVFFQPGGVRPIKNNLAAIDGLSPLKKEAVLIFAGPILDAGYGHQLANRLAKEPWIRHLPHIPPDAMAAAYRASDGVLNTSLSEGLSNALMEAMTVGRPILASDIPGNRDLLVHGETALLYKDLNGLTDLAAWLIREPKARALLGTAAQAVAKERFSTDREADALLQAYARARNC